MGLVGRHPPLPFRTAWFPLPPRLWSRGGLPATAGHGTKRPGARWGPARVGVGGQAARRHEGQVPMVLTEVCA